jgi:hypothetical protein
VRSIGLVRCIIIAIQTLQLLEWEVRLASSLTPYGAVLSGYIKVQGRLKEAVWLSNRLLLKALGSAVITHLDNAVHKPPAAGIAVWCLDVFEPSLWPTHPFVQGLIFAQDTEMETFWRVGWFGSNLSSNRVEYNASWFDDFHWQTITIV